MSDEQPKNEGIKFIGYAPYDTVKLEILEKYQQAITEYEKCVPALISGLLAKDLPTFIAKTISLYIYLKPKLERDKAFPNMALAIDNIISTGLEIEARKEREHYKKIFLEFSQYLSNMRMYMESNGITQYEMVKLPIQKTIITSTLKTERDVK
jgi:hypothetical protein